MDTHQRPYVCQHPGCPKAVQGYSKMWSLLRHEKKVHGGQSMSILLIPQLPRHLIIT